MKHFISSNRKWMIFLFWLSVWQGIAVMIQKEILFVSPFSVWRAFLELSVQLDFWLIILSSFCRMLGGYTLAVGAGVAMASLCAKSGLFFSLFQPLISIVKATPVASFSILALLWVKTAMVPIVISFLMVFPIVWGNTCEGFRNRDNDLLEMANVYGFTKKQKWKLLYVPTLLPYLLAACKTGVGMAWKASVAAEVICTPMFSIGKKLYESKLYLESPQLFAWTGTVILLSVSIEWAVSRGIEKMQCKMGFLNDENRI